MLGCWLINRKTLSGIDATMSLALGIAALCLSLWRTVFHPGRLSVLIALLGLSTATTLDSYNGGSHITNVSWGSNTHGIVTSLGQ